MVDAIQTSAAGAVLLPDAGSVSPSSVDAFSQQVALGSVVETPTAAFTYWGFGFTLGDVAKLGEKGLELLGAKLGIRGVEFAQRIFNFASDLTKFAKGLGIADPGSFIKLEFNFPISFKGADWKSDTVVHIKFNAKQLNDLGAGGAPKVLQAFLPNATPQEADAVLKAVLKYGEDPLTNSSNPIYLSDLRLTETAGEVFNGNFNPANWNARFGAMFLTKSIEIPNGFKTGVASNFNYEALGFLSPRIFPDGTVQLLFGAANDASSPKIGSAFIETGGGVSLKVKQLVKISSDSFGVFSSFNNQTFLIELPKQVSDTLPPALKDTAVADPGGVPHLTVAQAVQKGASVAIDPTTTNYIGSVVAGLSEVLSFAQDPVVRDGLILLAGISGFKSGPIVGTITTLSAVKQILDATDDDVYQSFLSQLGPDQVDPQKIIDLATAVLKADNLDSIALDQSSMTNVPIGTLSQAGNYQRFINAFSKVINRMDEEGKLEGGAIKLYQQLKDAVKKAGDDDVLAGQAASILLGNKEHIQFGAYGGAADFQTSTPASFKVFKNLEAGNKVEVSDILKLHDSPSAAFGAATLLDRGYDAFSLVRAAFDIDCPGTTWKNTPADRGFMYGDPRMNIAANVSHYLFHTTTNPITHEQFNQVSRYVTHLTNLDAQLLKFYNTELYPGNNRTRATKDVADAKFAQNLIDAARTVLRSGVSVDFGSVYMKQAIAFVKRTEFPNFKEGVTSTGTTLDASMLQKIRETFDPRHAHTTVASSAALIVAGPGAPTGVATPLPGFDDGAVNPALDDSESSEALQSSIFNVNNDLLSIALGDVLHAFSPTTSPVIPSDLADLLTFAPEAGGIDPQTTTAQINALIAASGFGAVLNRVFFDASNGRVDLLQAISQLQAADPVDSAANATVKTILQFHKDLKDLLNVPLTFREGDYRGYSVANGQLVDSPSGTLPADVTDTLQKRAAALNGYDLNTTAGLLGATKARILLEPGFADIVAAYFKNRHIELPPSGVLGGGVNDKTIADPMNTLLAIPTTYTDPATGVVSNKFVNDAFFKPLAAPQTDLDLLTTVLKTYNAVPGSRDVAAVAWDPGAVSTDFTRFTVDQPGKPVKPAPPRPDPISSAGPPPTPSGTGWDFEPANSALGIQAGFYNSGTGAFWRWTAPDGGNAYGPNRTYYRVDRPSVYHPDTNDYRLGDWHFYREDYVVVDYREQFVSRTDLFTLPFAPLPNGFFG